MEHGKRLIVQINGRELILLSEAADLVKVHRAAIWNAIRRGLIKTAIRFGGYTFVDLDEVRQWREQYYNERRAEAQRQRWIRIKLRKGDISVKIRSYEEKLKDTNH